MKRLLLILTAVTMTACVLVWCERMDVGLTGGWFIGDMWTYSIWPWILVVGWCMVGWSVGRMMGVEGLIYQVSVGLAVVATGLYGLGLVGLIQGWLVAGLGVGLIVWEMNPNGDKERISQSTETQKETEKRAPILSLVQGSQFRWSLLLDTSKLINGLGCLALVWYIYRTLPLVTLPAVGWDECNSHLVLPELYVQSGWIEFWPWVNFSNFPPLSEMLVTLQRLYTLTPGACWSYLATLGVLLPIYRLCGGSIGGWAGVMAYLMIPLVTQYSQMVLVDTILTFYGVLLVMAVVERRGWLTIGALAGACVALKYGGVVWVVIVAVVWGWNYLSRQKGG